MIRRAAYIDTGGKTGERCLKTGRSRRNGDALPATVTTYGERADRVGSYVWRVVELNSCRVGDVYIRIRINVMKSDDKGVEYRVVRVVAERVSGV